MLATLIMLLTFFTVFFLSYIILQLLYKRKFVIQQRLLKLSKGSEKKEEGELNQPLFIRIIHPILDDISKSILKITPKELVGAMEKKVQMAGKPLKLSVKEWVNVQVLLILGFPSVTMFFGYIKRVEFKLLFFLILIEIIGGFLIPNMILDRASRERQKKIQNSLPDVLDLLTVSVEAGLSFDGALTKVVERIPGPLAEDFGNVLQEMKVGKQKKDALRDLAERSGIQDLTTFISAVIQADQLGVSIGHVLRLQSDQMRQKRRQRAQEKAMKAPVKMLIPMILFIFPTIFSVLLGPVVIKVIEMFRH